MTAQERLDLVPRLIALLRYELSRNGEKYSGAMVPNLTSIELVCTAPPEDLVGIETKLMRLERERGISPQD